jgi:hypothetical protein
MGRPRLTDEEREARRKARARHSFSDAAYQHYDPKREGFGSAEEWLRTAEAAFAGRGSYERVLGTRTTPEQLRYLRAIGLTELPESPADLKKAFRVHLFRVHPDHGGTAEATRAAITAFEKLAQFYPKGA